MADGAQEACCSQHTLMLVRMLRCAQPHHKRRQELASGTCGPELEGRVCVHKAWAAYSGNLRQGPSKPHRAPPQVSRGFAGLAPAGVLRPTTSYAVRSGHELTTSHNLNHQVAQQVLLLASNTAAHQTLRTVGTSPGFCSQMYHVHVGSNSLCFRNHSNNLPSSVYTHVDQRSKLQTFELWHGPAYTHPLGLPCSPGESSRGLPVGEHSRPRKVTSVRGSQMVSGQHTTITINNP